MPQYDWNQIRAATPNWYNIATGQKFTADQLTPDQILGDQFRSYTPWDFGGARGDWTITGNSQGSIQGSPIDPALAQYMNQRYGPAMTDALLARDAYSMSGGDLGFRPGSWEQVILPALQQVGATSDPNFANYQNWWTTGENNSMQATQQIEDAIDAKFNKNLMMGLGAVGGVMGAGALGLLGSGGGLAGEAAAGLGEAGWGVTQGAGGMDWISALNQFGGLESLGGLNAAELAGLGVTPESLGLGGGIGNIADYLDFGSNFGPTGEGMFPTGAEDFPGSWGSVSGSGWDWLDRLNPFSSNSSPWGVNPSGQSAGGILGGLLGGNNLSSALGLAPILGGLAWGYNNTGFDTSKLNDLYNQYNPNAMAYQYDQNTLKGRDALTSGLQRRFGGGFGSSSFAANDLTNYNTQRDLGRAALIGQAVTPAANLAGQILNADVAKRKIQSDLIGQGLYSIGTLFGGRR